jgi:CheY-like chemotaxis protein
VLASGLWRAEVDPNQLENAILNLAVNARDAMPHGGKLTIETCNTHLDRSYAAAHSGVTAGQYVVICVSDTGSGMDEETVSRAFEPFFTTKEVGKGTGLGLSMVYGFVKQSDGHLKIYSEPGHGTTVKIYLPRLVSAVAAEEKPVEESVPEGAREETILVCEDDDDVRAYSVEVLRELGYRVLEAHDGPSALRLLERQEGRVDLLFTDVVLPSGMTGAVVAEKARAIRPGLKVLFTTGYARNAIVHHGRLDPGVALITKPFTYADLAAQIRDILDANP